MKALSLWQPWGSLWACGRKVYETRAYQTSHRGPLLIHAAQTICTDIGDELREICEDEFGAHWARALPRGALVGVCELVNCIPTQYLHVDREERAQGNFTPGRYGWSCRDARPLKPPIPYRGMQMLFEVPDDVVAAALDGSAIATPPAQRRLL